jgi:Rap1a immunity proteins
MRRTPLALILQAAFLNILPLTVSAQGLSQGDELLKYCGDSAESYGRGVCHGYILSIAAVLSDGNAISGHKACIPQAVNMGQIVDTSVRYVKDNAANSKYTTAVLIAKSLERSFPCP